MNELDKLRSLLLEEEREQLSLIQEEVHKLSAELRTPKLIIDHLAPLFASILSKSHANDEKLILDTFSPIVNSLIDKSYETSKEKISSQLAPLIGNAIREQIKSQKDDVVDALYPVIGSMISRYVSKSFEDMLNNINRQIQNGLSLNTLKRKIKAKLQGISETELLLKESATTNIRALFLIHKETGIVLCEAQNPQKPITESDMIASMLTAIKSFINDWIEKNEANYEIGEIEYGGSKILIETSGYSYLAVIIDGATTTSTYNEIRTTMENIVASHGEDIRKFDGDLSKFANVEIYKKIAFLLSKPSHENEQQVKKSPLLYLIPIFIIALISWAFYKELKETALNKKVATLLYKTPQLTSYRINTTVDDGVVTLIGQVPFEYHKQLASEIVSHVEDIKSIKNNLIVLPTLDDPMQISSNISYLLKGFNSFDGINVTYSYAYPSLTLLGSVWNAKRKDEIVSILKNIKGVKTIIDNIKIEPPYINESIYFNEGSAKISPKYNAKLLKLITLLTQLDSNFVLQIDGYSDEHGSKEVKEYIANLRAQSVANYLKQNGTFEQTLEVKSNINPPEGLTPEQARHVHITIKGQK